MTVCKLGCLTHEPHKQLANHWCYGQPWNSQTELAFATGRVAIGLSGNELLIRAELNDAHVMNDSFPFNFPAFKQ